MKSLKRQTNIIILFLVLDLFLLATVIFFLFWYNDSRPARNYTYQRLTDSSIRQTAGSSSTGSQNAPAAVGGPPSVQDSYSVIIASVRPSVVNIEAVNPERARAGAQAVSSIYRFENTRTPTQGLVVSGIIVGSDGYILTNYHSIKGAEAIYVNVFGSSDSRYQASTIKFDEDNDLALLKINATGLPVAGLGDSDRVETGDIVFAIGSPFGFEHSVSSGIISDNKRDIIIEGRFYSNMVQTDAAINVGNSGGPLVDIQGRVIGINTAIWAPTGVFTGVGFAIPVNWAKNIMQLNEL
jgi:S1-C subfamily serine protease